MKIGIIRERKSPPDRRVVLTPEAIVQVKNSYSEADFEVETSDIRVFTDEEYLQKNIKIVPNLNDCDVILGVKEIPVEALIPHKTYCFFSHTIKKQPYNQKLLKACLDKNIRLIDHETICNEKGIRLIGFGRYAGMVGAYNGIRAFGLKYELFNLAKVETLADRAAMIERLRRPFLPPIKIVVTGKGKVGMGIKEILEAMKIKEVSSQDFLQKKFAQPVYVHLDVLDYNRKIDGSTALNNQEFYQNPSWFESDFEKYTKVADIFMAGHFYGNGAPVILTQQMLLAADNQLKIVADVSCDVAGPIACTLRASTIAEPLYGYLPSENKEVPYTHPAAIVVMAVDNLPCELPKDASEGFSEMYIQHVIPAFFNNDASGLLERATITQNGQLTEKFSYLSDYANLI